MCGRVRGGGDLRIRLWHPFRPSPLHFRGVGEFVLGAIESGFRRGRVECSVDCGFVGERGVDRGEFWFGPADPIGDVLEPVEFGGSVWLVGGVDVGFVSGAGEGDVGALACGVGGDDEVGGVAGVPLGGEGVLHVGEAEIGLGDLVVVEPQFGAVRETDINGARFRVDVPDHGSRPVAQLSLLVVDGLPDLDLVAGV